MTPYHFLQDSPELNTFVSLEKSKSRIGDQKSGKGFLRGYTLLEILVSVGVFSMVMLAVSGAYFVLINIDKQNRAQSDAITSISFALDSMTREIRSGTAYACNGTVGAPNCPDTPGTSFSFHDSRTPARTITYTLSNGQIVEAIDGRSAVLTDSKATIRTLAFYVRGVGQGANATVPPQVTIVVKGTVETSNSTVVSFSLESAATERILETSDAGSQSS